MVASKVNARDTGTVREMVQLTTGIPEKYTL